MNKKVKLTDIFEVSDVSLFAKSGEIDIDQEFRRLYEMQRDSKMEKIRQKMKATTD
jgi:hypothetical protein